MSSNLSFFLNKIFSVFFRLSELVLFTMTLIIFYDVIMRYVFNSPTIWALEISEYMLVFLCFIGAADLQRRKKHIKMDFFYHKFSRRIQKFLDLISYLLLVVFSFILFWNALKMTLTAYKYESVSNSLLGVPLFLPYSIILIGMFLLLLQSINDVVTCVKKNAAHN